MAPETTTMKNDAPIIQVVDIEPFLDPSELSATTFMYDGLSDTTFEGIDDGMGDDDGTNVVDGSNAADGTVDADGTNDTDGGMLDDERSIEKLSSVITRALPNHSDKSLSCTKKGFVS